MTLLGGTTWRLAARMQEVRLIRNMAVQVIASVILFEMVDYCGGRRGRYSVRP